MSVPTYDAFISPLLSVLAQNPAGMRSRAAYDAVAAATKLSEQDRAILLPSGQQAIYENRIGWAHDRLKRAGYSQSAQRGLWQLTAKGLALAEANPNGLSDKTIDEIAFVPRTTAAPAESSPEKLSIAQVLATPQSPEEQIDDALEQLTESLSRDLLAQIGRSSPAFFERLVLDLLLAMGYGASRDDLQQVGGSGDGGIDGIIALDKLGLEKVYVQAKRWKGNVGRPEIQKFFGALAGRRATKGVFITTSHFSDEARDYAEAVSSTLVLVDGVRLSRLMIENGVGVTHATKSIPRFDTDYFEDA